MRFRRAVLSLGGLAALLAPPTGAASSRPPAAPVRGEIRIVAVHPHDSAAFTQGLVWHDGKLYESLGGYGRSSVREVELATGRVLRERRLPDGEFGEGLALAAERWIQLTWRESTAHLWRRDDLAPAGTFHYDGEGWGLTSDGERLVMSDGGASLSFRSSEDFAPLSVLQVTRAGRPEAYLNELEWADGSIYANIWQSDEIVRIDPTSGEVRAVFDAGGLLAADERRSTEVLNGIAWNPASGRFYLTGKLWPKLFEVEFVEPAGAAPASQP